MNNGKHKILLKTSSLALSTALTLSSFACAAAETSDGGVSSSSQIITVTEPLPDNDILFEMYTNRAFGISGGAAKSLPESSGRRQLDEVTQAFYDILMEEIRKVAEGDRESTSFRIAPEDVTEKVSSGANLSIFDLNMLINAMLSDNPYEFYWYDKTVGISVITEKTSIGKILSFVFNFRVSSEYSRTGETGTTEVNTQKISLANKAVKNAESILNSVESNWSDFRVMTYFKDKICELVSYNYDAAYNTGAIPYGDPWQMIYVFDGDTKTNVVCEGYTKAFKYLCDKYSFNSDIKCSIVTGQMAGGASSGGHMWNVVSINNKPYFVDITNSDKGSIGEDGDLFFCGVPEESRVYASDGSLSGIKFKIGYSNIMYVYDNDSKKLFYEDELNVSHTSPNLYTIKWVGANDSVIETDEMVAEGEKPVYNGSQPVSATGKGFLGWLPDLTEDTVVSGDETEIVFTAQFEQDVEKEKYTVSFVAPNGEEYYRESVPVNTNAVLIEPELEGFTFEGWYKDTEFERRFDSSEKITEDTTLYAKFVCEIVWQDFDGTVLERDVDVLYGDLPTYDGEIPVRSASEKYSYKFSEWSPEVVPANGNAVYTAQYSQEDITYTVTWKNYDGTILETDNAVIYDEIPEYNGDTPTRESTQKFSYTFDGWTPEITSLTGNIEYIAKYKENLRTYHVRWLNWDGSLIASEEYKYGETPVYNSESDPVKPEDSEYTYTFNGWNEEPSPVEDNIEYTAQFTATKIEISDTDTVDETDTAAEDTSSENTTDSENTDTSTDDETDKSSDDTTDSENTDTSTDDETDTSSDNTTDSENTDTSTDDETDTSSDNTTDSENTDTSTDDETDTSSDDTTDSENTDTSTDDETDTSSDNTTDSENTDTSTDGETDTSYDNTTDSEGTDTSTDTNISTDSESPIDERKMGDVNNDGIINSSDALIILRSSLGMELLDKVDCAYADVNGDTVIKSDDALLVLRYSVGIRNEGNVGEIRSGI